MAILKLFTSAQKRHIDEKITIAHKKIWDLEFLRINLADNREGIRKQYDRLNEEKQGYEVRIEKLRERGGEGDAEEVKLCQARIEALDADIAQFKEQMSALDNQIQGDGGVNQSIDGYHEVIGLLKKYRQRV